MGALLPKAIPLIELITPTEGQPTKLSTVKAREFIEQVHAAAQWPLSWPTFDEVGDQVVRLVVDTAHSIFTEDTVENPKGMLGKAKLEDLEMVFADPEFDDQLITINQMRADINLEPNCMYIRGYEKPVLH